VRELIIISYESASFLLIVVATGLVGTVSLALAAFLSFRWLARYVQRLISFSIGILLATAFLHLLPEAFAWDVAPQDLFALMLVALLTLFFLEKVALFRHDHHYEGDGHVHEHGHDRRAAGRGGALVLIGSGLHNFVDGVLIAGAFMAGPWVGLAATVSVLAHEVPHKISDFLVLINAGLPRRRALTFASISAVMIVSGGVAGYYVLERAEAWIPYVLVLAGSSFIYIALSDLVPQMQRGEAFAEALKQAALIACGIAIVLVLYNYASVHAHQHTPEHEHEMDVEPEDPNAPAADAPLRASLRRGIVLG